jgi:hypothetical protein
VQKIYFQIALTVGVLAGGSWVALNDKQPLEIRLSASGAVAGAVTWWLRSPLDSKDEQ